ncbi:MAG: type II toxin-antitoxin system RelE/ParE family toxin [Bacteroidales bacterium]|nr:type II toxin-antitoxin system RelE/ParE family toxin [Bacteroidales bacterium]
MIKVIWTGRALSDLEDIRDYIAKDSDKYARLTIEKLINTARLIENHPLAGRIVPEINIEEIREIISGNYRIIYHYQPKSHVYILTVHHGSGLLSNNPFLDKTK